MRGARARRCSRLSVESRDAVNATLAQAAAAGGRADPNPAQDHGFMFGRSVEDPDGNVWEIMWMDPAALAQKPRRGASGCSIDDAPSASDSRRRGN